MKPNIHDYEFIEAGSGPTPEDDLSGAPPAAVPTPKSTPAKNKIVTKEELAKSGYDNLRDYLNAQRGLTRRKDPVENATQKAEAEAKPAAKTGSIMDKSPAERDAMVKLGLQRQEAERAMKDFKAKKTAGYAKGGSVKPSKMGAVKQAKPSYGSASSRADGIATKGKTRGRYI